MAMPRLILLQMYILLQSKFFLPNTVNFDGKVLFLSTVQCLWMSVHSFLHRVPKGRLPVPRSPKFVAKEPGALLFYCLEP